MKERVIEKAVTVFLNLFKVKSLVTFATVGITVYMVKTNQLEAATVTAIVMMVFQSLFNKDKTGDDNNGLQNK